MTWPCGSGARGRVDRGASRASAASRCLVQLLPRVVRGPVGLPVLAFPVVLVIVLVCNGVGEEAGWRGFLTPRLLESRGPLITSLIVAAIWFAWHAPLFWVIESYRNMGLAIVPMMALGLISGSIVLTWLYLQSGGGIWIVALWHVALNFGSATTAGRGLPGAVIWVGVLVWAIFIVVGWLIAADQPGLFVAELRNRSVIAVLPLAPGGVHPPSALDARDRALGRP